MKINTWFAFRALFAISVSIVLLSAVFWRTDFDDVARGLATIDLNSLGLAFAFVTTSIVAACFRYWNILRTFGQDIGLAATVRANLLGLVGGLLFFQVIGQTLSRWAALRRSGVSPSSVVVTSLYERILALAILLCAALVAALLLYDGISLELQKESLALAKSLLLIVLSAIAVSAFVLRRYLKLFWRSLKRGTNWNAVAIGVVLTVFVHGAMLSAYLSLILAHAPMASVVDLSAASIIIMLAASFPISFAGWGVRELGAVFAFGYVGVGAGDALAVSITLGAISVASIAALAGLALFLPAVTKKPAPVGQEVIAVTHADLSRFVFLSVPIGVASLIMFHVWLPIGPGFVNVNLADPMAILGGIVFLLYYKRLDFTNAFPGIIRSFGLLSLLILASLILGWWRFGYTDWAFINRGLGWLIILSYVATGGLLMVCSPVIGPRMIIRILLWVAIVLVLGDIALWILGVLGFTELASITPYQRIFGESLNPNAFGFQLLLILAGILGLSVQLGRISPFRGFEPIIFGFLVSAIFFTQSRTAVITALVLMIGAYALGFRRRDIFLKGVLFALVVVLTVSNLGIILQTVVELANASVVFLGWAVPGELSHLKPNTAMSVAPLYRAESEAERWQSILNGITLFREHPIFGGGLGAGVRFGVGSTQQLVIHSTPVWILADFGLVGFTVIGAFFLLVGYRFLYKYYTDIDYIYVFGVLILLVFAIFGLSHDIFYQRLFWFFLGMIFCRGIKIASGSAAPEEAVGESRAAASSAGSAFRD